MQREHGAFDARLIGVKLQGNAGRFEGYGAVFGNVDYGGDVIQEGAFTRTLEEWKGRQKLPPMLLQHGGWGVTNQDMLPVGQWLSMEENKRGLKVEGQLFALGTELGQYIQAGLKSGVLDGLSIGYEVKESILGTKPAEPRRTLVDVELMELSIVTFPMNPKARITDAKSVGPRELERLLRFGGASRSVALRLVSFYRPVLESMALEPRSDSETPTEPLPRDAGEDDDKAAAIAAAERLLGSLRLGLITR